jgi:hypothetical protein
MGLDGEVGEAGQRRTELNPSGEGQQPDRCGALGC